MTPAMYPESVITQMTNQNEVALGKHVHPRTRAECLELDHADPLAWVRDEFDLPDGVIYLAGNSLGALPRIVSDNLHGLIQSEWADGLVRSWNTAGWIDAPRRVGDKLSGVLGARPGEVMVADSTSVNLFKVLIGLLRLRSDRRIVLTEEGNFPTDLYIAQGVVDLLGGNREVHAVPRAEIPGSLDCNVAVLMLTHVDYATAEMYDMQALTQAAHEKGTLALWDLSHSAGAVPVDLTACEVDTAIGCGYKYLNGGPGAPAYVFLAERWWGEVQSPIWGWMGHAKPFDFDPMYRPDAGSGGFIAGTPHMLSMAGLEAALDLWTRIDRDQVWRKSRALSELMIRRIEERCDAWGVSVASPKDATRRGSHLAVQHQQAYPIMRALIDRGVIGDYRPPDVMRFALTPLYTSFANVWDAVEHLAEILESRSFEAPEYSQKLKVT